MTTATAPTTRIRRAPTGGVLGWIERRIGLTATGLAVIALIVVGFVAAQGFGSRAMYLLVLGMVLVVVSAWVLGRRRLRVDAERSALPPRVREGQLVDVEVTLSAKRRLATVVMEDSLPDVFGAAIRVPVPVLPAGKELTHRYTFTPRRRGVYEVGPLVVEWSDPFGLTTRRAVLAPAEKVIVHPSTELVHDRIWSRAWEDPPIRPPVSKPWPTGFEFYGMRDYVHGDDPRRIVWRASARTIDPATGQGRYLVREAEQGITDHVALFLDTDRESHSPGDPSETFETMIRAAASLGAHHLGSGFSLNVDANSRRLSKGLRGARSKLVMLDELAALDPEPATFTAAIDRLLVEPNRATHNVVITPHLSQEIAARIRVLLERGRTILLVLVLWESSDSASMHRAGSLGCPVVELRSNLAFEHVFSRVIGTGRR